MICEKCNKKLMHVKDVVGDPFMYCPDCCQVWVERVINDERFGVVKK